MDDFNKINLKEEFLKMYVKEATPKQLEQINMLLEQGNYQQINAIIDEYTNRQNMTITLQENNFLINSSLTS